MLAKATEQHQPMLPGAAGSTMHPTHGGRFARDPGEYASQSTIGGVQLTLIPGGLAEDSRPAARRPPMTTRPPRAGPVDPIGADLLAHPEGAQARPDEPDPARAAGLGPAAQDEPRRVPANWSSADEITRRESRSAMLRARAAGLDPDHADRHLGRTRRPHLRPGTPLRPGHPPVHRGRPRRARPRPGRGRQDPPRHRARPHRDPPPAHRARRPRRQAVHPAPRRPAGQHPRRRDSAGSPASTC